MKRKIAQRVSLTATILICLQAFNARFRLLRASNLDFSCHRAEEEKNDLVTSAIEVIQGEINQLKRAGQKDVGEMQCMIQEIEMHIVDLKKDTFEFKRDVIIGGENAMTGALLAETIRGQRWCSFVIDCPHRPFADEVV